jgi:outer membrane protein TolC
VTTTDLSFTWSLLDFGQSYYASKQNADRLLIAMERRRKALHNLVQDVRTAYWRVVAADKLGKSIRETITDAEAALQTSESTEGAMLRSPMEPLRYQRQLLENLRMLETVDQELSTAKLELAALTSLPMGTQFTVVEPKFNLSKTWLSTSTDEMELH